MEQTIVAAVELFEMVNDVLYQAQVNTRLIAPKTKALRVSQIRQYFTDRMLKEGNDMGIEYVSNEQDFAIVANEPLLRRVIANLLGNAIYHGRPGDEVSLKFSRNATHAFIWVRDTGLGFDDANTSERAANFTRMVQKVRQRVQGAQSTRSGLLGQRLHGLGLASIERICTELNGTMTLRSHPKHGSVFCLRLPLDNPQQKVRGQALKK